MKTKKLKKQRYEAAEDACWRIVIMMQVGALEEGPFNQDTQEGRDMRAYIGEPLDKWLKLQAKTDNKWLEK